ncbi:Aerobic cobaltochelatase subunit CobT [Candidatus Bartonella washoeensis]|nr:Aerobic cobaltochelatase subunit CobT [Bartonella washoeensis]
MTAEIGDNNQSLKNDTSNSTLDAEAFKKALSTCIRAIAGSHNLEVAFSHNRPSFSENYARLPELPKHSTNKDITVTRGLGDSMALRKAWHDNAIHTRFAPIESEARAIFDALEQTRVEAIGTLAMEGIAKNLDSMLADKYQRAHYESISTQNEAPIQEAIALLLREKITGRPPPKEAGPVLELWRHTIEEKVAAELNALIHHIHNQNTFARIVRQMLVALKMAVQLEEDFDSVDNKKLTNDPVRKCFGYEYDVSVRSILQRLFLQLCDAIILRQVQLLLEEGVLLFFRVIKVQLLLEWALHFGC